MRDPRRHALALLVIASVVLPCCGGGSRIAPAPAIEFTRVPEAGEGGPDRQEVVEGRVAGARPGQQVVLFAKSGVWWVQPLVDQPFTPIREDSTWRGMTHLGTEYAALLVDGAFRPPARTSALPSVGVGVLAVAIVEGRKTLASQPKVLRWSGYEWKVRAASSERGGHVNAYLPDNAWTDDHGALHLRISTGAKGWGCSEVSLTRSLGYGSYSVVVRDASRLDPRSVLSAFTWDESAPEQNYREMTVEISRWGDPANQNAQFVVQPYFVPANVSRFTAPAGPLNFTLRWEPGAAHFRASRGGKKPGTPAAEHVFTSGVPDPGAETLRLILYVFADFDETRPIRDEVVFDSFEYLP